MTQNIDTKIYDDFEKERVKLQKELEGKAIINSSQPPGTEWMQKVTSKVRISDLASEHGIDMCPLCNYSINFDDMRGWFICINKKYNHKCSFSGNIVDFMRFCKERIW